MFLLAEGDLRSSKKTFFGHPFFYEIGTNVYQINLWFYLVFAMILYTVWLGFQYWIMYRFHQFFLSDFASKKFTLPYMILCGVGYINLYFWVVGMEGNVFGFLFALPLMMLAFAMMIMELQFFFKTK